MNIFLHQLKESQTYCGRLRVVIEKNKNPSTKGIFFERPNSQRKPDERQRCLYKRKILVIRSPKELLSRLFIIGGATHIYLARQLKWFLPKVPAIPNSLAQASQTTITTTSSSRQLAFHYVIDCW